MGLTVLFLTVLGVFGGIFYGGFPEMWKLGRAGDWSWWQYALAVPAMGALYLLAEGVAFVIFAPFVWLSEWESPWKLVLKYSFVAVLVFITFLGLMWLVSAS